MKILRLSLLTALAATFVAAAPVQASTVLATTDFGTTDGSNLGPFTSGYTAMPSGQSGVLPTGSYTVGKSGTGYSWSSWDWGGVDHTTGTGDFMVVDGSTVANVVLLSYTVSSVTAGQQFTFSGWLQDIISGNMSQPTLQLKVNGTQVGSTFGLGGVQRTWEQFSFNYTATQSGPLTFSLYDTNTASAMNDYGLDDVQLSTNAASSVPEPSSVLLAGLGLCAALGMRRRKSF